MRKAIDITFTPERLRELLGYDRETGIFTRKWRPEFTGRDSASNTRNAGRPTGSLMQNGYITISINASHYLAHRLAWVFEYGSIKITDEIDHINGVRADNRIVNLRNVTRTMNSQNTAVIRRTSTQLLGVSVATSGRWVARANANNRTIYLGTYSTKEEATKVAWDFRQKNFQGWTGRES